MGTLNDTLTQQLRRIRAQKELSIDSMAEKLGVSPEGYIKIENGETALTLKGVENIAKVLEVSAPELLNTPAATVAHNSIIAEENTCGDISDSPNSNNIYMGVSSEVLEKLLQRIDILENELATLRKTQ